MYRGAGSSLTRPPTVSINDIGVSPAVVTLVSNGLRRYSGRGPDIVRQTLCSGHTASASLTTRLCDSYSIGMVASIDLRRIPRLLTAPTKGLAVHYTVAEIINKTLKSGH